MNPETPMQFAQAAPDAGGSPIGFWLMMGALFLVMYAVIIHPQRKQQKEQAKMIGALEKGDDVVTTGGIHGRITGVTDEVLTVQIGNNGNNVKVKMDKSAISRVIQAKSESGGS